MSPTNAKPLKLTHKTIRDWSNPGKNHWYWAKGQLRRLFKICSADGPSGNIQYFYLLITTGQVLLNHYTINVKQKRLLNPDAW